MATQNIKKTKSGSIAAHLSTDDGIQVVGIGNLRVLLIPETGGGWFAQGLEIDYGAQGATIDEAKKNFEDGLAATIDLNLRLHGSIDALLASAPSDVLVEAAHNKPSIERYTQISVHEIGSDAEAALPYSGIEYFKLGVAA